MIGVDQPTGRCIASLGLFHHREKQRHLGASIGKFTFVIQVHDQLVALLPHRPDGIRIRAVDNPTRGHDTENLFLMPLRSPL